MSFYPPAAPGPVPAAAGRVVKPLYKRTWFLITGGVAVMALLCCGAGTVALMSGDDPVNSHAETSPGQAKPPNGAATGAPAAPRETVAKLGEQIEVKDGAAGAKVQVTKFEGNVKSNNKFVKPSHGQFVAAWVEVVAVSGESDFGPSNFRLIGPDGSVFNSSYLLEPMEQMMDISTKVRAGQKKSGWVVFDCAPGNYTGSKIEMNDDFGQRLIGTWQT